jgi:hypothetical protein
MLGWLEAVGGIWKEAVVVIFKLLFWNFSEGSEENHENS